MHTYDILRNHLYVKRFQYVSPYFSKRKYLIKDGDDDDSNNEWQSDIVRLVLNMSMWNSEIIQHISVDSIFSKKGFEKFVSENKKGLEVDEIKLIG